MTNAGQPPDPASLVRWLYPILRRTQADFARDSGASQLVFQRNGDELIDRVPQDAGKLGGALGDDGATPAPAPPNYRHHPPPAIISRLFDV